MRKQKPKKTVRRKPTKHSENAKASESTVADEIIPPESSTKTVAKAANPFAFFKQVRAEGEKVTWTTRNETVVSTILVLVMVIIMSIFFTLADQAMKALIQWILSINI